MPLEYTRPRKVRQLFAIAAIFLLSRIFCSGLVYWGHSRRTYLEPVPGGWIGVPHWLLNPWTTYDSEWYMQIATSGYEQSITRGFFPLYPWLLRLFAHDQVSMAWAGIVISHLAFFIGLLLVFRLTEIEWDRQTAYLTVVILALTPAAPFWGAVYTESLFLSLLAGTFLAARTHHWWRAGLLGFLAALCRNPGFLIAIALFVASHPYRHKNVSIGQKVAWTFPLLALCAVQTYIWSHFNDSFSGYNAHFYRQLDWPWAPIARDVSALATKFSSLPTADFAFIVVTVSSLAFTSIGLLLPVFGRRTLHPGYLILIGGITLMNLTLAVQILPSTISGTRYMAPLFPVAQVLAIGILKLESPFARMLVIGPIIFMFTMFSYMFGYKIYLG